MRILAALVILLGAMGVAWWIGPRPGAPAVRKPAADIERDGLQESDPVLYGSQSAESPPEVIVLPQAHAWSVALCPGDMVWVGPAACPSDGPATAGCVKGKRTVSVCMDPFEYPSQQGVFPAVMLDYRAAEEACKSEGKRLCSETEWAFACSALQDETGCNLGRTELVVRTLELGKAERVSRELASQDGRRPNGESSCVNDFRVFDLIGNVQEWVRSEHPSSSAFAVKGGRYNQVSIGCSRTIYVSDPWSRYPHTGVRCCADPLGDAPSSP